MNASGAGIAPDRNSHRQAPAQNNSVPLNLHRDAARLQLRTPAERGFDLVFDFCSRHVGLDRHRVGDAGHAICTAHRRLGELPLKLPADFAFQHHPIIADRDLDFVAGNQNVVLEFLNDIARNLGNRSPSG